MVQLGGWPVTPARTVRGADGGVVSFRERLGPTEDAPAVLLLHGLGATSALQFTATICQLSEAFRVVALDIRRPRSGGPLLSSVARDAVAVLDELGVDEVVVLGYSVGGLVARRLAGLVPRRVTGVVLAATADPPHLPLARWPLAAVTGSLGLLPTWWPGAAEGAGAPRFLLGEVGRLSPLVLLGAVQDAVVERAPSPADLDVPVAFVITTRDRLVPVSWQRRLAATRPDAPVLEVAAGHAASGLEAAVFGPVALEACALLTQPSGCTKNDATI